MAKASKKLTKKKIADKTGSGSCRLRRLEARDIPLVQAWLSEEKMQSFIDDEKLSSSQLKRKLKKLTEQDPIEDGEVAFVVELAGEPFAFIHLMWINWISRNAEVTLLVGPASRNNSFAGWLLIQNTGELAFDVFNLNKIYGYIFGTNPHSLSVFGRIAKPEAKYYVQRGDLREDVHILSMHAHEYHALMEQRKRTARRGRGAS